MITADRDTRPHRRDTKRQKQSWTRSRKAEKQFSRTLRSLAKRIGTMTREMFDPNDLVGSSNRCRHFLDKYSETIRPWAEATARRMVGDVSRRDEAVWSGLSKEMGRALSQEIKSTPIGEDIRVRQREVVDLITSLPREAAERIGTLTLEAMTAAKRSSEVTRDIMKTGRVTQSRAELIARTEVARTASLLVQARSEHVGSDGYIWRTSEDSDVRHIHRKLNGKFFRWDAPPVAGENGERAHAGAIYNCRCWPEPVIPDEAA